MKKSLFNSQKYRTVLATYITKLSSVKEVEYITQPGARPKRQRQFKYPSRLCKMINDQIAEWDKVGRVAESDAQWIHPIVLMRKKSLTGKDPNEPLKYTVQYA